KCLQCNKLLKRKGSVYCNRGCMTLDYRKTRIELVCAICNKNKKIPPSYKNRKYCSKKCYHISHKNKKRPTHSQFMVNYYKTHKHPLTFLGKTHTNRERQNMSKRMISKWQDPQSKFNSKEYRQRLSDEGMRRNRFGKLNNGYSHGNSGWYKFDKNEIKYYFRSDWEVLYARYLEYLKRKKEIKDWQYEIDVFWFLKIKRGVRSYKPDFKLINNNESIEYHEVKGWMDNRSKTKIKRMAKYYPSIKLLIIGRKENNDLKKIEKLFPAIQKL
ncbi:MAG: hypothetical protein AABY22_25460, partial [Nanoarchaeota archaeon]